MPLPLTPVTLRGNRVRLEPLSLTHAEGLRIAATESRESFRYTWVPEPTESEVVRYIESALSAHTAGTALPFEPFAPTPKPLLVQHALCLLSTGHLLTANHPTQCDRTQLRSAQHG